MRYCAAFVAFFMAQGLFAQVDFTQAPMESLPGSGGSPIQKTKQEARPKSTQCTTDTIQYTDSKATAYQSWEIDGTGYLGFGQYYDAPQTMDVEGVRIFAYAALGNFNADTVFSWVKIYDASPVDSLPLGAALDSVLVPVTKIFTANLNDMSYNGVFASPVTIAGSGYFVSLEYTGADTVTLFGNSVINSDGAGENLAYFNYQNVWYRNIDFIQFDSDWILEPIVNYVLDVEFTIFPDTLCLSVGITDTTCTLNNSAALHKNRMYNQDYANPDYLWNWGDGDISVFEEGCHIYFSPGLYTITLDQTITGWSSTCADTDTATLFVGNPPDASFTYQMMGNGTFDFTGVALPTDSVVWNFGDNTGTSTQHDPSHTYAGPGTFSVFQIVTNECGSDTSLQVIMYTPFSIEEESEIAFSLFPNPATDVVVVEGRFHNADLHLYDATGRIVATQSLQQGKNELAVQNVPKGVYLLEIIAENKRAVQRLVVQ